MWTINKVDKIEMPVEQVGINEIVSRLPDFLQDPKEFIETSIIRPTSEILDISDLTYRLHWATRHSDLESKNMPANLNNSIVMERHRITSYNVCYTKLLRLTKWKNIFSIFVKTKSPA